MRITPILSRVVALTLTGCGSDDPDPIAGGSEPGVCPVEPGEALPIISRALTERGIKVMAEISLDAEDTKNPNVGGELLRQIIGTDPLRGLADQTADKEQQIGRDVKS